MTHADEIHVQAERPYTVTVRPGCLADLAAAIGPKASRVAFVHPPVLTDLVRTTAREVDADVTFIEVPAGEPAKTVETLADAWNTLAEAGFTRSDVVVGMGGGATTDLAGFVAASYLRGVPYISVPTTLLAMVDAAVGGKTGINLPAGKNLVGAFYEPTAVLCDLELLTLLPEAEVSSGMAEIVKAGFIRDARITELVAQDPADALDVRSVRLAELVRRAIQFKADVVTADLREATTAADAEVGREALNYGHTLGHAIEKQEHFTWRHGEAVSVGLVYAAELARRLGLLDDAAVDLHREQLAAVGLPITYTGAPWEEIRATMSVDKKARGSKLRFVLLDGLGKPVIVEGPDETVLREAYETVAIG
ncbi:MAG TPA: 3-dehydroquinate synthase [Propionibacteriaceae bacterium]|nr:3-dehydroquinate synthase [Propionibacteriaceae bacterium]HPZ49712.1 3-dehydroquinate synthase [Propionibacteriaceae bacterium]HQE30621.1 3-dehydroquinate synthase [Propionibacteriaceae bacterium]